MRWLTLVTLDRHLETSQHTNTGVQATDERGKLYQEAPKDNPTEDLRERSDCCDLATSHGVNSALGTPSDKPATVLAVQIHANRERFPGCILLTRVGQFYEARHLQSGRFISLMWILFEVLL